MSYADLQEHRYYGNDVTVPGNKADVLDGTKIASQMCIRDRDIREDRVAQLKERLDSGNYNVDMNDFANKLLEKYNALVK